MASDGHGVDPQDKGAGKATTYSLKNCLLYTFLTPVGKIDDTDTTHSDDIKPPVKIKLVEYTDDLANRAITKGVGLTQFKKSVNVTPKEAEAFKRMENEYNKGWI